MFRKDKIELWLICIVALILRATFTLFFAKDFFNRPDIYSSGDTNSWLISFINLWENGQFSANIQHEYGYFFRMPGYSFFMGIFYLGFGNNPTILFPIIGWTQILIDIFSVIMVYKISLVIFNSKKTAIITSGLYTTYPFIIVWNPVCYSETTSVFFLLLSLFFYFNRKSLYSLLFSGLFLGIGILTRPQIIIFIPVFVSFLFIYPRKEIPLKYIIFFLIGLAVTYGLWPVRNIINHKKIILTQDLRSAKNWNSDVISFMQYTYSVKAEWEPQFTSIIHNKKTEWPLISYRTKPDSILLEFAVHLSKNYGSGFSYWNGYWKDTIPEDNSKTKLISTIFTYLRINQIKHNPVNFWLKVPLQNLSKAIFKISLYKSETLVQKMGSYLFFYRTFLILFGFAGSIFLLFYAKPLGWFFTSCFILLYFILCFGALPQMRNIEMRYFLHADILLLFPASYLFSIIFTKFARRT